MDGRRFFEELASVYEAGAKHSRGWLLNYDRQGDAEILEAQAKRAREIAKKYPNLEEQRVLDGIV